MTHKCISGDRTERVGRNDFYAILRRERILMGQDVVNEGRKNVPYAKYIKQGYFVCREEIEETPGFLYIRAFLTTKGQQWLEKRLRHAGYLK